MVITCMMKSTEDICTINIVFECPGDLLVSNTLYNISVTDQFMLVARIEGFGSKYKKMAQSHLIVFFDMGVVGSEEKILRKRDDADKDLTEIFSGMDFEEDDNRILLNFGFLTNVEFGAWWKKEGEALYEWDINHATPPCWVYDASNAT
jgi:hypothetical protein